MVSVDDSGLDMRRRAQGGVGGWLNEEEDGWRDEVGESYYLDMLRDDSRNKGMGLGHVQAFALCLACMHRPARQRLALQLWPGPWSCLCLTTSVFSVQHIERESSAP
jgi:hypothetical protein